MIRTPPDENRERRRFYRYWYPDWPPRRVWEVAELWRIYYL